MQDYLDEDPPLRGQSYACVSFLSPEDVLAQKDVFYVSKFLDDLSGHLDTLFENLKTTYPEKASVIDALRETHGHFFKESELQDQFRFFKAKHGQHIEKIFHEKNEFRTSVRGFKVRGVFDTVKEAEIRAQVLKRHGDKHNIYVAQMGCWVPWDPQADQIAEQKYTGSEALNQLMAKYNENMNLRNEFYEERKADKIKTAMEERDTWLQRREEENASTSASVVQEVENVPVQEQVVQVQDPAQDQVQDQVQDPVQDPAPVQE